MKMITDGKRKDGRALDEMRPIKAKVGVLKNATGSAHFEFGNTKAVAGVFGPREVHPRHEEEPENAILRTQYSMAPFATTTRNRPGPSRRSKEISFVIQQALKPAVVLKDFPKSAIDVHIEVLQANASTRCAALNAASMALADAGIHMRDLISCVAAGKVEDQLLLDVSGKEDTEGQVDFPIAYYPKKKEMTLMQLDGLTNKEEIEEMMDLAVKGCKKVNEIQKKALRKKYEVSNND